MLKILLQRKLFATFFNFKIKVIEKFSEEENKIYCIEESLNATFKNSLFVINPRSRDDKYEYYNRELLNIKKKSISLDFEKNFLHGTIFLSLILFFLRPVNPRYLKFLFFFANDYLSYKKRFLKSPSLCNVENIFITNYYNEIPFLLFLRLYYPNIKVIEVQHGQIYKTHPGYNNNFYIDYIIIDDVKFLNNISLSCSGVFISPLQRKDFTITIENTYKTYLILSKSYFKEEILFFKKYFDKNKLISLKLHPRNNINDITKFLSKLNLNNYEILVKNIFVKYSLILSGNSSLGCNLENEGFEVIYTDRAIENFKK